MRVQPHAQSATRTSSHTHKQPHAQACRGLRVCSEAAGSTLLTHVSSDLGSVDHLVRVIVRVKVRERVRAEGER